MTSSEGIQVVRQGFVNVVTLERPPHNFVDPKLIGELADTLARMDEDHQCRAVVLAASGRSFCAGANFSGVNRTSEAVDPGAFYAQAMRLFRTRKPIVAAVHGAAVGAGLGLALVADFRVTCAEARFSANFTRLGFHPGFGLSVTLPRLIGEQTAALLFYTGRRVGGAEAVTMGLADELVAEPDVRKRSISLAQEIAISSPLAVQATRATLRHGLAERIATANERELEIQRVQFRSRDFQEGIAAMTERRDPVFLGC
ncbi:MAG: enoyl-CoA hydratase [Betaproteobacteria bacterium RIFCSPLOWO2_12_FULL_65_14]|nr:MAG: enoyl-CoA hydratase [Betaproteobacteria bacterium RIFCSPLOWO2_12_FULL_65_14]